MSTERAKSQSPKSLSGLLPFLRPYRTQIALAGVFLVMAALATLAFPLALLLGMERFSALRLLGLACGLTGVVLIALPQAGLPAGTPAGWVLFAMIGPLFYAIEGNVVARWGTAGLDPVQAMLAASVIGAVMVLPLTLASGQWIDPRQGWGAPERALILSSVIHAFMYAGYVWLAGAAGAVFATQTSYVVTAAGVGWAMLLLGERFSLLIWVAGATMLLGLALVQPRPAAERVGI
jgi:drug/metabolite transporter (DMT)-like permease